jgi:hypothetical protein
VASGKKRTVLARHVRNRRLYNAIDRCPEGRAGNRRATDGNCERAGSRSGALGLDAR